MFDLEDIKELFVLYIVIFGLVFIFVLAIGIALNVLDKCGILPLAILTTEIGSKL